MRTFVGSRPVRGNLSIALLFWRKNLFLKPSMVGLEFPFISVCDQAFFAGTAVLQHWAFENYQHPFPASRIRACRTSCVYLYRSWMQIPLTIPAEGNHRASRTFLVRWETKTDYLTHVFEGTPDHDPKRKGRAERLEFDPWPTILDFQLWRINLRKDETEEDLKGVNAHIHRRHIPSTTALLFVHIFRLRSNMCSSVQCFCAAVFSGILPVTGE